MARLLPALALVLGALLSVVSAAAYKVTTVPGRQAVTVVATGSAALALRPGPTAQAGNAAATAYTAGDGRLHLDFTRGYGQAPGYGFAAGQRYRFRRVFEVVNNSASTQAVSVYVPGGGINGLAAIYGRTAATPPGNDGTLLAAAGGSRAGTLPLAPAEILYVDVWWDLAGGAAAPAFTVRAAATRV